MGTLGIRAKMAESLADVRAVTTVQPKIAVVLGTGMYGLSNMLDGSTEIEYHTIRHMPRSTVASHQNKLIFGRLGSFEVVLVAGRFHYYEGYSMDEVTYYIHLLKSLGVERVILTSASGGLNADYEAGEIVVIKDHINLFPDNPLRGQNDETLGPRFPDMLDAYSKVMRNTTAKVLAQSDISLKEGVYIGWQGPSLETPAEYSMLHHLGADLVGMSTVPEVITCVYTGMEVLAFSIISNLCFPPEKIKETTVEDVIRTVNEHSPALIDIIQKIIPHLYPAHENK